MHKFREYLEEEKYKVQTKHLIHAVKVGDKVHLPKSRHDTHTDITDRLPQHDKDEMDYSDDPDEHFGFLHLKTKKFIQQRHIDKKSDRGYLDSSSIPYSKYAKNWNHRMPIKNREVEVDEETVETKHLIPAIHNPVTGKIHLPKSRKDIHYDIIHRMDRKHQDAIDAADDPDKHFGFYHIKKGHRKFIPGNKTRDIGGANSRLDSYDIPYSRSLSKRDRVERGVKNKKIEVDEELELIQSKHLIPAVHVNGKVHLPKKRNEFHGHILGRLKDEDAATIDRADNAQNHIGYYHMKKRKFIPGHKIISPAGYSRLDSTEIPYSTKYREKDWDIKKPKNRDLYVTETSSHANDNYNPKPPIKKWRQWMKDNPGHPDIHKVATTIQQAQDRLRKQIRVVK